MITYRTFTASVLLRIFTLVLSSIATFCATSVTASLERDNIMAGETITLSIVAEGGNPQLAENFPPIPGLSIQYNGTVQSITSVNGQTSIKRTLNFSLSAREPGQYTIPSIRVNVNGTTHSTRPLSLTVAKADPAAQNRYAFLRLNVPTTEIYVGEILPIELQLYVIDAEDLKAPQLKSDGFVIHKQLPHVRSQAQVGNTPYVVLTFPMTISAAKAGKLNLGPAEMSLVLRLRAQPDPNDLFGFFGRYQRRPLTIASPTVELNVLPLPTPAPNDFTGAIGSFDWSISAAPTNLNTGDPITLRAVITGRGNFDNLKLPDFSWPEFKTYQPSSTASIADPLGIHGSKTFEQVIVPESASIKQIPPITFSFFNPSDKKFVTLAHPATPLQVKPGSSSPVLTSGQSDSQDGPVDRSDIVHIKTDLGQLALVAQPLFRDPWFLFLQGIPLAGLVGITLWKKRQDQISRNPKLRRKLEVQQTIQHGLAELRHFANSNETGQFYALLFRLMQEQVGERLDLPASAITEAVLDDLPRRGASQELVRQLHTLFQLSNQARYAPVSTHAELLSLSSDLEKALNQLQQLPD
jgi:hypothetical protein